MKTPLKNSRKFDELYTPTHAVTPLLKYIPNDIKVIWCPCDKKDSKIVDVLCACGFEVIATHIDDGCDFLNFELPEHYDMIITNPPYSIKDKILERCYKSKKPFALLLPLTALEGSKRHKMFEKGIGCIVFDRRIDFNGKGNCWYNTSWFIHTPITDGRLFFEKLNGNNTEYNKEGWDME